MFNINHLITQSQKNANKGKYYVDCAKGLVNRPTNNATFMGVSARQTLKSKYDRFNGILPKGCYSNITNPISADMALPADMANRDIISPRLKRIISLEMQRSMDWRVIAVNEDATTQREQEEFGRIKEFVVQSIMRPIVEQAQKTSKDAQEQEEYVAANTPDVVRRYMVREFQLPEETMARQLINLSYQENDLDEKFNTGWKDSVIGGKEVYYSGLLRNRAIVWRVNPMYFDHDSIESDTPIEDGDWAVAEYHLTPSKVMEYFGDEFTSSMTKELYESATTGGGYAFNGAEDYNFWTTDENHAGSVLVKHCVWKGLRKIGFLTYKSPDSPKPLTKLISEEYSLDKRIGDISIKWMWVPEVHECMEIANKWYVNKRPIPNQHKDLNNLYTCKLPYIGICYDATNSVPTSYLDRMISLQDYYNIILYRVELLMASDNGKMLAMNLNAIPTVSGIDTKMWMHFMKANKIAYFNPNEEGNRGNGLNSAHDIMQVLDMSLISDINNYIAIANMIEAKCGEVIGMTPQFEGQIEERSAARNVQQSVDSSMGVIELSLAVHNRVKRAVLQSLLENAKVAVTLSESTKYSYVLDDLSLAMLDVNRELLDSTTYGIYIGNNNGTADVKKLIRELSLTALQNQQADLSDIIKVLKHNTFRDAEEALLVAEEKKQEQIKALEKEKGRVQMQIQEAQQKFKEKEWAHEAAMIKLKAQEDRETGIAKQAILAAGFDNVKDMDGDNVADVVEYADGFLKSQELLQTIKRDADNKKLAQEKLDVERIKANKTTKKA